MTLKEKLMTEGRTRWLDVGCGPRVERAFEGLDLLPESEVSGGAVYHHGDILNLTPKAQKNLGTFDLIRMQHCFEHFTPEEGQQVLRNCAKLIKKGGYVLITVPDLRVFIRMYLNDEFKDWPEYTKWVDIRLGAPAPNSAYFSNYAHNAIDDPHKWCYDYEGLEFQLKQTRQFTNIRELKPTDPLASTPFTHNRPAEDACAIAQKI